MILSAPIVNAPPSGLPFEFSEDKARELAKYLTLGVDTAEELCRFYELNADQTRVLMASGYFKVLLAEAQDELRNCNTVIEKTKAMARLATPEMLTNLIRLSRQGDDIKVSKDASETVLNLAGLATKSPQVLPVGAGQNGGIAISITFSGTPAQSAPVLKDVITVQEQFPVLAFQEQGSTFEED